MDLAKASGFGGKLKVNRTMELVLFIAIAAAIFLSINFDSGITGFTVLDTGGIWSQNSKVQLEQNVTFLRVSGSVIGTGNVTMWLGQRLVYDSRQFRSSFENVCVNSCEEAEQTDTLKIIIEGDALLAIISFNYTNKATEEQAASIAAEELIIPFALITVSNSTLNASGVIFNRTEYNTTGLIQINSSDSLQELPNNQYNESNEWRDYGIDMSGNVLLFHLDNNTENSTTVRDWSGNRNNGTWINGGQSNGTGKLGAQSAMISSLNGYLQVINSSSLNSSNAVSVSLWFNPSIITGNHQVIIEKYDDSVPIEYNIFVKGAVPPVISTYVNDFCDFDTVAVINTWHHVVMTNDATSLKVYTNGILENTCAGANYAYAPSTGNVNIGLRGSGDFPFAGAVDEVSIWNRSLSATEVLNIYNRQKDTFIQQGEYQSEIFDAGSSANWTNLSWVTEVCYQCELPNDGTNENSLHFRKPANMTDNLLLFHYNQSGAENLTYFKDYSGKENNGTCINCPAYNVSGKFESGYTFDGINDVINITDNGILDFPNGTAFTFATWIFPNQIISGKNYAIYAKDDGVNNGNPMLLMLGVGTLRLTYDASASNPSYDANIPLISNTSKAWHHVAFAYQFGLPSSAKIYWDGQLLSGSWTTGAGTETVILNNFNSIIGGREAAGSLYLNATIDETSMWNKTLNETYIQELYKRGISRLNLSVRSCDDAFCAGESYTDVVNDTSKQILLPIVANRYFQYRQMLTADDSAFSPHVYNTSIEYIATIPNVTITNPSNYSNFSSGNQAFNTTLYGAGVSVVVFQFSNRTNPFNVTSTNISENFSVNIDLARISEGLNNMTIFANDSFNQINNTEFIQFRVDRTPPLVRFTTPANDSSYTQFSYNITFSVRANDSNLTIAAIVLSFDNSTGAEFNLTLINNSGDWNRSYNMSALAEGAHTTTAIANDTAGNYNRTQSMIFTVDKTPPNVTAIIPIAGTLFNFSVIEIAANVTDNRIVSMAIANITYPNNSVTQLTLSNGSAYATKFNISYAIPESEGTFTIAIYANDSANNINATQTTTFTANYTDIDGDKVRDANDTLLGDYRFIATSGITSPNITVNGSTDLNKTFAGYQELVLYDNTRPIVNITHNFSVSTPLDLRNWTINVSTLYLLVNLSGQLLANETKTMYIDDNNFATLCVKDAHNISSAEQISTSCTEANETSFTGCIGVSTGTTSNGLTCYDDGAIIRIQNMSYSALRATQSAPGGSSGGGGGGKPRSTASIGAESRKELNVAVEKITASLNVGESLVVRELVVRSVQGTIPVTIEIDNSLQSIIEIEQKLSISEELTPIDIRINGTDYGSYTGYITLRTADAVYRVLLTIQVKKKVAKLLDLRVSALNKEVKINDIASFRIELFNLGQLPRYDVLLTYELIHEQTKQRAYYEQEQRAIETSLELIKSIELKGMPSGEYKLLVTAQYDNMTVTVQQLISIVEQLPLKRIPFKVLLAAMMLIIVTVLLWHAHKMVKLRLESNKTLNYYTKQAREQGYNEGEITDILVVERVPKSRQIVKIYRLTEIGSVKTGARTRFAREFKPSVLTQLGTSFIAKNHEEHNNNRNVLYRWKREHEKNPKEALRSNGKAWKEEAVLERYERLIGRQALEIDLLKKSIKHLKESNGMKRCAKMSRTTREISSKSADF